MTSTTIRAVAFDLGGTLEHVYYDDALRLEAAAGLRELLAGHGLDPGLAVPELLAAVTNGMAAYRAWREVELIEAEFRGSDALRRAHRLRRPLPPEIGGGPEADDDACHQQRQAKMGQHDEGIAIPGEEQDEDGDRH